MTVATRATLLALGVLTWSAGPVAPAQDKKDPQAAYEPTSKPGAGQQFLEKFVGDWDVIKTFHPKVGEPFRVKGECKQTMIHEGRFLRSEFVFFQGETRTTGTGIIGYESDSGAFTSVWVDSRSTKMSLRRSKDKFNGQEIVLYSQSPAEAGKPARLSRTVTRLEDAGRKIVHRQYAVNPDGSERLVMELEMTRKEKSSASGL
jgi:hypothetical protein